MAPRRLHATGTEERRLAKRVRAAADWLIRYPGTGGLRIGYFGRDTAAAAALMAAADHPERVSAVVAHGGRPGLASEALVSVRAPTSLASTCAWSRFTSEDNEACS